VRITFRNNVEFVQLDLEILQERLVSWKFVSIRAYDRARYWHSRAEENEKLVARCYNRGQCSNR